MLRIDCSKSEGGGQSVRTSVAMSTVIDEEVYLTKIRENRPTSGLSRQHCSTVDAVSTITGSEIIGNYVGSRELIIKPGKKHVYDATIDFRNAESISLVLQAVQLAASTFDHTLEVNVTGGTNIMWTPPIDSYQQVLYPLMSKMGIKASVEIIKRGFFPDGGGQVRAIFEPVRNIRPLILTTLGKLKKISGVFCVQHLPTKIGEQMAEGCYSVLGEFCNVEIENCFPHGDSKGACISLVAEYENGFLGSNTITIRGRSAIQSGVDVATDLLHIIKSSSTLDVHTADQLLPYMAMANGISMFSISKISRHLLSQMNILETFLNVKFNVEKKGGLYFFTVIPGEGQ